MFLLLITIVQPETRKLFAALRNESQGRFFHVSCLFWKDDLFSFIEPRKNVQFLYVKLTASNKETCIYVNEYSVHRLVPKSSCCVEKWHEE